MKDLTSRERAVLSDILCMGLPGSDDEPGLKAIREQVAQARIEREMAGVGILTRFRVPPELPRLPNKGRITISGPDVTLKGMRHGASFILHCMDGVIQILEGYSHAGETWPDGPEEFEIDNEREFGGRSYQEIQATNMELFRSLMVAAPNP